MSEPTREVELKARVEDLDATRARIERAGATLAVHARLRDRIYDSATGELSAQDIVLRLRRYETDTSVEAHLDWKGPTARENGFKVRSELTTGVSDPAALATMLEKLGYRIVGAIDREIIQYSLADDADTVSIRFEVYPRMDTLVEVEGSTAGIEKAVSLLGISRDRFSADRLVDFVRAYELRTGQRAAVADFEVKVDEKP